MHTAKTTIPSYIIVPPLTMRNTKAIRVVAIMQLIIGGLLFLLEVIGLGIGNQRIDLMSIIGAGIWNGLFFILTGTLGVLATRAHTGVPTSRRGLITAFMVMSILSSVLAIAMFIFSVIMLAIRPFYGSYEYDSDIYGSPTYYSYYYRYINYDAFLGVRVTSLLLYFAQFICFIVAAAFGCCNVCCGGGERVVTQQVVYHAAPYPGQQPVLYFGTGPQMVSTVMQPPNGSQFMATGPPPTSMQGAPPGYSYIQANVPQLNAGGMEKQAGGV